MTKTAKIFSAAVLAAALLATVTVARTIHPGADGPAIHTTSSANTGTVGYARPVTAPAAQRGIACGSVRIDCDALENMVAE
jgi:hypothetical protein